MANTLFIRYARQFIQQATQPSPTSPDQTTSLASLCYERTHVPDEDS